MDPILLFTNTDKINSETAFYNSLLPFFQGMYDALQEIGVTPTLQDLNTFAQWAQQPNNRGWQLNYVTNYLVQQAAGANFNGVLLDTQKLKSLISVPDLTNFIASTSIASYGRMFTQEFMGVNITYLQLVDNVISLVPTAAATIAAKWTLYTATDAGVTKTNELQAICDTLNAYDFANGKPFYNGMYNNSQYNKQGPFPLIGLTLYNGQFIVSPQYIKTYEANN